MIQTIRSLLPLSNKKEEVKLQDKINEKKFIERNNLEIE